MHSTVRISVCANTAYSAAAAAAYECLRAALVVGLSMPHPLSNESVT